MPGTLNWRAGPDEDEARPTGVLRLPGRSPGDRLGLEDVIDVLAQNVEDVIELDEAERRDAGAFLDWMLERYAPGAGEVAASSGGGSWAGLEVLGDLGRLAQETLMWDDVLVPAGWHKITAAYG